MEAKAVARQVRVSPIKVRRVLALIRGKKVGEALVALQFSPQKSAKLVGKVLQRRCSQRRTQFRHGYGQTAGRSSYGGSGAKMKRFRPCRWVGRTPTPPYKPR